MLATIQSGILSSCVLYKNPKIKIHEPIILPVVPYGCEIWSLTLREKHKLRVFENKILRRIFGPMIDEVTECWRKLHNEEIHNLKKWGVRLWTGFNWLRIWSSRSIF
jgi:hypothetical protein